MEPMAQHLNQQGYRTINIPYPSFRDSIEEIVDQVITIIAEHDNGGRIHFVTHSLGGIILRHLLAETHQELIGRIVMLAPPNQGSEIIDWLEGCIPLAKTLGPAGAKLGSDKINAPGLPQHLDSAIIMGKHSAIPFFRWLLDSENDGIVSVNRGKIDGVNEFHITDTDHTFITSDPLVLEMTLNFLTHGYIR